MTQEELQRMFGAQFGGFQQPITREYTIKIWLGDAVVQDETMKMDERNAEHNFKRIFNQLARDNRPMKAKMRYVYHSTLEDFDNYIQFENKPWENSH